MRDTHAFPTWKLLVFVCWTAARERERACMFKRKIDCSAIGCPSKISLDEGLAASDKTVYVNYINYSILYYTPFDSRLPLVVI